MRKDSLLRNVLLEAKLNIKPTDRIIMSNDKDLRPRNVTQASQAWVKPEGLWYALGKEWINWVKANMPQWKGDHLYKIEVNTSRILLLNSMKKVGEFEREYGVYDKRWDLYTEIHWKEVAKKYDGVEYLNPWGKTGEWNRPWDVSSGCIWKASAIKKIEKIQ